MPDHGNCAVWLLASFASNVSPEWEGDHGYQRVIWPVQQQCKLKSVHFPSTRIQSIRILEYSYARSSSSTPVITVQNTLSTGSLLREAVQIPLVSIHAVQSWCVQSNISATSSLRSRSLSLFKNDLQPSTQTSFGALKKGHICVHGRNCALPGEI